MPSICHKETPSAEGDSWSLTLSILLMIHKGQTITANVSTLQRAFGLLHSRQDFLTASNSPNFQQ